MNAGATTPVLQLGDDPTLDDLTTTHTHMPRFNEAVHELTGSGWVTRICIGGCGITTPADHYPGIQTTTAP